MTDRTRLTEPELETNNTCADGICVVPQAANLRPRGEEHANPILKTPPPTPQT